MVAQNDTEPKLEQASGLNKGGWTVVHSWIFLAIVAIGFVFFAWQNRYHYLSPLGLGKAYRIDKLFGGIQEFDPSLGWITAQLQAIPPQPSMSMMEPTPSFSQAVPMHMPGSARPMGTAEPQISGAPETAKDDPFARDAGREAPRMQAAVQPLPSSSPEAVDADAQKENRLAAFQKLFPEFGQDEFQLANDDLYPDWKKTVGPTGTWNQFLPVYKDFVQWWNDSGSPQSDGFKLWRDFLASRGLGK